MEKVFVCVHFEILKFLSLKTAINTVHFLYIALQTAENIAAPCLKLSGRKSTMISRYLCIIILTSRLGLFLNVLTDN